MIKIDFLCGINNKHEYFKMKKKYQMTSHQFVGPLFAVDPPRRFNRCRAAPSSVLRRMVLGEQLSVSSLSGLVPAAPFANSHPLPSPPRGGCALSMLLLSL